MWRALEALFGGLLIGLGAGIVLGLKLYPLLPAEPQVTQAAVAQRTPELVARGAFIQTNPYFDRSRYGKGKVSVYDDHVLLEDDFEVSPGPGFRVLLVPKSPIRRAAHISGVMYVDLGPLRAFAGAQKYDLPRGLSLKTYKSVVIWGATNKALISAADLAFAE